VVRARKGFGQLGAPAGATIQSTKQRESGPALGGTVAQAALERYGDDPAVPSEDLAANVASEARLIRAVLAERAVHARRHKDAYLAAIKELRATSLDGASLHRVTQSGTRAYPGRGPGRPVAEG